MTGYARRALPWTLLGCCALLVLVAMALVARWPHVMWPLQGVAVGLLAAAGAWCVDEPAAAVVDAAPRSLRWRTTARSLGLLPMLGLWIGTVVAVRDQLFGHAADVGLQGCVALVAGCAIGTWARTRGLAAPGRQIATATVPAAAFLALTRPVEQHLPLFPYLETGPWASSLALWTVAGAAASALLATSLSGTGSRCPGTGLQRHDRPLRPTAATARRSHHDQHARHRSP